MNLSEVALLLGTVTAYDLRIQVDELKVRAWAEALDFDISLEEGRKLVFFHYSNFDTAITPSHINRESRRRKAAELERERGRLLSEELERQREKKASPESVQKYLEEIRSKIGNPKNASVDADSGEVAPNS